MTREKTGKSGRQYLIIEPEFDQTCDLCGVVEETRPYGPNGKNVCFTCAMKPENKAETDRRFALRLEGK